MEYSKIAEMLKDSNTAKKKPIYQFFDTKEIDEKKYMEISRDLLEPKEKNEIAHHNVYQDLEVFTSDNSVFDAINNTNTIIGSIKLKELLINPLTQIKDLNDRQVILKQIIEDNSLYQELLDKLSRLSKLEKSVLWLIKDKTKEEQRIIDMVYFKTSYLKMFNDNENTMLIYNYFRIVFSPVYGLISPLLLVILPYLYLHFFTNMRFSFKMYIKLFKMSIFGTPNENLFGHTAPKWSRYFSAVMTIFMYCQNIYNSYEISKNTNEIINEIHKKLNDLREFIDISNEIYLKTKDLFKDMDYQPCFNCIKNSAFKSAPSIFSNKGKILVSYRKVVKNKNEIKSLLRYIGNVDSFMSITTLFKNNKEHYCLATYDNNSNPNLVVNDLWHCCLDNKTVIKNNITMGNTVQPNNILITGPNAGGKSTFIKSLTISVLLAQTLCVSNCSYINLTPFSIINTYLNIPDCKGKESLFEAEMHRARDHINILKSLDKDKFGFVVMDEIFSSTNPEEGISGGYAIAEKLSEYSNSIACITTHFSYLTNLEKNGGFKNYKIPITRDEDNNIVYPYKVKEGKSTQFIALELLKKKGFDESLVTRALGVCSKLDLGKNELLKNIKHDNSNNEIAVKEESGIEETNQIDDSKLIEKNDGTEREMTQDNKENLVKAEIFNKVEDKVNSILEKNQDNKKYKSLATNASTPKKNNQSENKKKKILIEKKSQITNNI